MSTIYYVSALIIQCLVYHLWSSCLIVPVCLVPDTEKEIEGYKERWAESSKSLWWVEKAIQMRAFLITVCTLAVQMSIFLGPYGNEFWLNSYLVGFLCNLKQEFGTSASHLLEGLLTMFKWGYVFNMCCQNIRTRKKL